MVPKDRQALRREFLRTVQGLTGARRRRWERALATLETDPLFRDAEISVGADPSSVAGGEAQALFESLSSGHKIVLLAMTHLADSVAERTLVLIDEPETHLHPPLLSAFIRALSDLLIDRNGVAIIATHSPVVLQETPRTCVWKLRRSGSLQTADQPEIETFGENVGILTREAFGLEVTRSGFHREIEKAVRRRPELRAGTRAVQRAARQRGQRDRPRHDRCPGPPGAHLMWPLPMPGQTARDTYLLCISRITCERLRKAMLQYADAVAIAAELYADEARAANLYTLNSAEFTPWVAAGPH